jgi:hypothetical protein
MFLPYGAQASAARRDHARINTAGYSRGWALKRFGIVDH